MQGRDKLKPGGEWGAIIVVTKHLRKATFASTRSDSPMAEAVRRGSSRRAHHLLDGGRVPPIPTEPTDSGPHARNLFLLRGGAPRWLRRSPRHSRPPGRGDHLAGSAPPRPRRAAGRRSSPKVVIIPALNRRPDNDWTSSTNVPSAVSSGMVGSLRHTACRTRGTTSVSRDPSGSSGTSPAWSAAHGESRRLDEHRSHGP